MQHMIDMPLFCWKIFVNCQIYKNHVCCPIMPEKKKKKKCLVKGADKPKLPTTVETNATITNLHVTNSSRVARSIQGEDLKLFLHNIETLNSRKKKSVV